MSEPAPTVRGQELGDELRLLRENASLSLAEAAHRIDASASKLSRFETGRRSIPLEDVASLLAVYGVSGTRRRALLALARDADRRGWWQRDRPGFAERQRTLISLEARAERIINFEGMVVPGLLQTGEYTRAVMEESGMVPDDQVENLMATRLRRHSVLLRPHPPVLQVFLDELVLHRVVGGRDVLRRQLDHLLEASCRQHVGIRVVPNRGAHAGTIGAFALIRQRTGPPVVFVEHLTSSLFIEERHEVQSYGQVLRELSKASLDERQSVELISSLAEGLRKEDALDGRCRAERLDLAPKQLQQLPGELRRDRLSP